MQQLLSKTFTYQTRLHLEQEPETIVDACAALMCKVERTLFADIASGKNSQLLKSSYLKRFEITARQFNACRVQVEGKIASIKELRKEQIIESKSRIADLERKIKSLEKRKASANVIHQKKRRLSQKKNKLKQLIADHQEGKIRLCFGSKKLFRAQFYDYDSHKEWQGAWRQTRNSSFFLLGSKDETAGNQSCSAILQEDGTVMLRLRLPNALVPKYGKYLTIPNVRFKYGHDMIIAALQRQQAISYRFKKDAKGWRLFASVVHTEPQWITRKELGAIGVDINADHLAVTETDRFGNPIAHTSIPLVCYGKTKYQAKALIGDAAAKLVNIAIKSQKPLVLEKLNFKKKKTALKESCSSKQSRMLSSFSYNAIITHIKSRAFRFGVHVGEVNPAFTSVIGRVKFAKRYGLSIHESAALCVARRYLGVSERLPRLVDTIPDGKGGHVAFSLPVRNRDQHVWSLWRQIQKKLKAAPAAHILAKRSSSRSPPACRDRRKPPRCYW